MAQRESSGRELVLWDRGSCVRHTSLCGTDAEERVKGRSATRSGGPPPDQFCFWLLNVPATCECISRTDLLNFTCCHTENLQTKLSISPSHSIPTPGQPVPALTL